MAVTPTLNERAQRLADHMASTAAALRIAPQTLPCGGRILDCGVKSPGGLQAGLSLARICLAGQAEVGLVPGEVAGVGCPLVQVSSDNPVLACMASQYAGWQISVKSRGCQRSSDRERVPEDGAERSHSCQAAKPGLRMAGGS